MPVGKRPGEDDCERRGNKNLSYCPKCGKEVGKNDRFCHSCGASIITVERRVEKPLKTKKPSLSDALGDIIGNGAYFGLVFIIIGTILGPSTMFDLFQTGLLIGLIVVFLDGIYEARKNKVRASANVICVIAGAIWFAIASAVCSMLGQTLLHSMIF